MKSFLLLSVHFLLVTFALILQELRKQLKKTNDPEITKELKDRLSWIVRTYPFDLSCLFGSSTQLWYIFSDFTFISSEMLTVFQLTPILLHVCRTNSWSTNQWSILNVQFWLSTRKKRGKQQSKENNHFILRNVSLSLSLWSHLSKLLGHIRD